MVSTISQRMARPALEGKFIRIGDVRYYIKGVTYGTFAPDEKGSQFPAREVMEWDFRLMWQQGINTIRTYTVPTAALLDTAYAHGLKVMVGLPWEQHLTFLDSRDQQIDIIRRVKEGILSCGQHPAILCYTIGNEIPSEMVRWYGEKKVRRFLYKLFQTVKQADPEGLVTYVNYPTTEYLELPFLDFVCFNVFLEEKAALKAYLQRIHNLIGDKPLVLTEIGLDSLRHGLEKQAEVLNWQLRTIFEKGCAGAFVFSWTDEWWRGGAEIEDWDFGIVGRDRNPKPANHVVRQAFQDVPVASSPEWPRISVVVCSYNSEDTIRDTMEGLMRLEYPDYEVIVVNDGSNDATPDIVSGYDVTLISTENRGLSRARNTGLEAATGDIVAYIDGDAYPDPQWLRYLATAYLQSSHGGIGGPNIAPAGDGWIADCISNAPGGPMHVLSTDEIAEHIPGCNMSFRREVLLEIGGFDPVYRSAGDDVDICWRVQEAGYTIGFHPSAFVWHHCRNSFGMYWRQQMGYGKAEALLEQKWPGKYNGIGHMQWAGHIYGTGLTQALQWKRKKIFYGSQGSGLFQIAIKPQGGFLNALPLMPEWYLLILFLGGITLLGIEWAPMLWAAPLLILSVLLIVVQAVISANKAVFKDKPSTTTARIKYWSLTSCLHLAQPLARLTGRIRHGLTPWRYGLTHLKYVHHLFKPATLNHWSEQWRSSEHWLRDIEAGLDELDNRVRKGGQYDRWDIHNRIGPFAAVRSLLTIEEHGMGRQYLKLKRKLIVSWLGVVLVAGLSLLALLAYRNQAFWSFSVLEFLAVMLTLKMIADISYSLASLAFAFHKLPSGVEILRKESVEAPKFSKIKTTAVDAMPAIGESV